MVPRRLVVAGISGGVAAAVAGGAASAAHAVPGGTPVTITAFTTFEEPAEPDNFLSSIGGCETGTVEDASTRVSETAWGGVFRGIKSFSCAGGEGGFDVRLVARFGEGGSTGTWTIVGGWGSLDGLKGSGSLVGIPAEDGIDDVYTGLLR